jgi:hypothetical protein
MHDDRGPADVFRKTRPRRSRPGACPRRLCPAATITRCAGAAVSRALKSSVSASQPRECRSSLSGCREIYRAPQCRQSHRHHAEHRARAALSRQARRKEALELQGLEKTLTYYQAQTGRPFEQRRVLRNCSLARPGSTPRSISIRATPRRRNRTPSLKEQQPPNLILEHQ